MPQIPHHTTPQHTRKPKGRQSLSPAKRQRHVSMGLYLWMKWGCAYSGRSCWWWCLLVWRSCLCFTVRQMAIFPCWRGRYQNMANMGNGYGLLTMGYGQWDGKCKMKVKESRSYELLKTNKEARMRRWEGQWAYE